MKRAPMPAEDQLKRVTSSRGARWKPLASRPGVYEVEFGVTVQVCAALLLQV